MHIFVRACRLFDLNLKQSQLCVLLIVCVSFLEHLCSYVKKNANVQTMANLAFGIILHHPP